MNLESLRTMTQEANGYLRINPRTQDLEVQHTNFLGKLVAWVRYKTSADYRKAIGQAAETVVHIMTTNDKKYYHYFSDRLGERTPELLQASKLLSARGVHRYMTKVSTHAEQAYAIKLEQRQLEYTKKYIASISGYRSTDAHCEALIAKIQRLLSEKQSGLYGIGVDDIKQNLEHELYRTAIADEAKLKTMTDKAQIQEFVEGILSDILDQRVAKVRDTRQSTLLARLSATDLPPQMQAEVESEIKSSQIVTESELNAYVNKLVLNEVAQRFDELLSEVCESKGFDPRIFDSSELKKSMLDELLAAAKPRLSMNETLKHATEILRRRGRQQVENIAAWISKLSGTDEQHRKEFQDRLDQMFETKTETQSGLNRSNVRLDGIDTEIHEAASRDATTIATETQAAELINGYMSDILDQRIATAGIKLRAQLRDQLAATDLSPQAEEEIASEIDTRKITEPSQLNRRLITAALKEMDTQYNDLAAEAAKKYGFSESLLANADMKEQLQQHLKGYLAESQKSSESLIAATRSEAVAQLNRQRTRLVEAWVQRRSGNGEGDSHDLYRSELNSLLSANIDKKSGIRAEDVPIRGLELEVQQQILSDPQNINAIENEEHVKTMVRDQLSALLKPRIEQTLLRSHQKLYERLSVAELPTSDYKDLETAITESEITTMDQLDSAVNRAVVKQIDAEFETLFKQAKEDVAFSEQLGSLSTVKAHVCDKLLSQDTRQILSVSFARAQSRELLTQWLSVKKEALTTIKPSRFSGSEALLKRLVLQEPYMTKEQVAVFQQAIETTLDELYKQNPDVYDALGMSANSMLSKLRQLRPDDALFNNLRDLVRQAAKPDTVFDDTAWHTNDVASIVRSYVSELSEPLIDTYKRVESLKGQVPDAIYREASKAVIDKGAVWGSEFISIANELYTDTLKEHNNAALYKLLDSSELARTTVGTKANGEQFTFKDLVESTLSKKDIKKEAKRRQAIAKLIPAEQMERLLDHIADDLTKVSDKVIDSGEANRLFIQNTLSFLQDAKLDFEAKKIDFNRPTETPPHYETTV